MVFFGFAIRNSDGSDNQRTYGLFTGSNVSLVGGNYEQSVTGSVEPDAPKKKSSSRCGRQGCRSFSGLWLWGGEQTGYQDGFLMTKFLSEPL